MTSSNVEWVVAEPSTIASINRLISTLDNRPEREIFLEAFEGFPEPSEFDKSAVSEKGVEHEPHGEFKYSPDAISKVLKKQT